LAIAKINPSALLALERNREELLQALGCHQFFELWLELIGAFQNKQLQHQIFLKA
jgi:hypothetical protein